MGSNGDGKERQLLVSIFLATTDKVPEREEIQLRTKQRGGVGIPTWEPMGEGQHCPFGPGGRVV
jgi:hypothetical protein